MLDPPPPPPPPPSAPRRILKRAGNLLTSNGQPAVKELMDTSVSLQRSSQNKLSASIKRKFREVKDVSKSLGRSRSLSVNSKPAEPPGRKGHARSQSDAHGGRPQTVALVQSPSEPYSTMQSLSPVSESTHPPNPIGDVAVPQWLQAGTTMTKISSKKHKTVVVRLDPDRGQIVWESKQHRLIPIESIKEIRSGIDARYYREQFQLAQEYEDRWLTIIYLLDGNYKTLHLVAASKDAFLMWDVTLRRLHAIRQQLMSGLGNIEMRQAIWEKLYWRGADEQSDDKLSFDEVEKMCKRLNINSNTEDLLRLFKQADTQDRNYLEFSDFQKFVKLLKSRPEVDRLYNKLRAAHDGIFDFDGFEKFMREHQESSLSLPELRAIFDRYSTMTALPVIGDQSPTPTSTAIMTRESFTSFLLSTDNSAFADQHGKIWHDMTRPLSEYYISSSHNTYLVGHQLVGVSTIEGYIRALLHSCRSVEVDIYDGDYEPMIFHGKTFTSKVSLRQVCQAIAKYGFVASPYPIIISAEIHCGIAQQDMVVQIMTEVFGDALVSAPINGRPRLEALPSPEDLRGRILMKAKNVYISRRDSSDNELALSETSASSTSDSDAVQEVIHDRGTKRRESDAMKELGGGGDFLNARAVLQRVRSVGKSSSSSSTSTRSPSTTPLKPPGAIGRSASLISRPSDPEQQRAAKPKMSFALLSLLVYTVGVKCRGINKKEEYAPEHMFSLSENMANKMMKAGSGMADLIKHSRTHLVRTYPRGTRVNSTNYEPHRFWSAGAQLVAMNWQTFDLGYMINHAMFQRNGRSGYVLKPSALRSPQKELLSQRTNHILDVSVISAQQLPRPKDSSGREIIDKSVIDPFVEVSVHVPDWTPPPESPADVHAPPATANVATSATSARTITYRTSMVKNNGFNPVWEERIRIPFDCVGGMLDLIFVRFAVKQGDKEDEEPLAVYCASLGSLAFGYRHLPLHDTQLSQYLFSTLFVQIGIQDA